MVLIRGQYINYISLLPSQQHEEISLLGEALLHSEKSLFYFNDIISVNKRNSHDYSVSPVIQLEIVSKLALENDSVIKYLKAKVKSYCAISSSCAQEL